MDSAVKRDRPLTADEFLQTDQDEFGAAWRYELVDGVIKAAAAPSPDHGAIASALNFAIGRRLDKLPQGCRAETGSGAVPRTRQRNTARIPDILIRCGQHPRVAFEIVSPSELRNRRARDRKRRDMQGVEGIQELVELFQDDHAAHVYRRRADGEWTFEAISGRDAVLHLPSVNLELPLAEIYAFVQLPPDEDEGLG